MDAARGPHVTPPIYVESSSPICPRCDESRTRLVPPITPESPNAWRECQSCGHLWVVRDEKAPHTR